MAGEQAAAPSRWVGIDQGYSQMGLAVLEEDDGVACMQRTTEPPGNGHDGRLALARLELLLDRVAVLRQDGPVRLAGFCYAHSGVASAFERAGWTVAGTKSLNDVVGVFGLSRMDGDTIVAGCGTYAQVVHIDAQHCVCWPGEDVAAALPSWPLCGEAYAQFVRHRVLTGSELPAEIVQRAREALEGVGAEIPAARFAVLGPILSDLVAAGDPAALGFVANAAATVRETCRTIAQAAGTHSAPLLCGGGAVADDRLWRMLTAQLWSGGVRAERVWGPPAVGLARYAAHHPDADPWRHIGRRRPAWLA